MNWIGEGGGGGGGEGGKGRGGGGREEGGGGRRHECDGLDYCNCGLQEVKLLPCKRIGVCG